MKLLLASILFASTVTAQFFDGNARRIMGRPIVGCGNPLEGDALKFNRTTRQWKCLPGDSPPVSPGYAPTQALAGCGVEYTTGLSFVVGACTYTINGATYTSPITTVTLDAADPTNPRIDLIGVNDTGVVFKTAGTPAATPSRPTVDPATQVELTFAQVNAAATTPADITTDSIYDENTEWTETDTANIAEGVNANSYSGSRAVEATTATSGNNVQFTKPSGTIDLATRNALVFYIKSKGTWPSNRQVAVWWSNGSTQRGNQIILRDGTFNFDSSITASYQQVSIPTSLFGNAGIAVNRLRIQVSGSGSGTIGWYLDKITLQAGFPDPALPSTLLDWKGPWSSATAYNPNDVVTSGGATYLALASSTNVAVTTTATWERLSPPLPVTVANGGTGLATLSTYAVITGGTTATGNVQQVSGLGTSGQLLQSAGAGALPVWATVTSQSGTGISERGTYAARPVCDSTVAGKAYYYTDSVYQYAQCNGTSWQDFINGKASTIPVSGDFAWINQGDASVSTTRGGVYLNAPGAASANIRLRKKASPAVPYTVTACFDMDAASPSDVGESPVGIAFRESGTSEIVTFGWKQTTNQLAVFQWTNATTLFGTVLSETSVPRYLNSGAQRQCLCIEDDNTNRKYKHSPDGITFTDFTSEGRTTFLTADEVGHFVYVTNANGRQGQWLHTWKQGTTCGAY